MKGGWMAAAALLLATTAAIAQQAQPTAGTTQPPVLLGIDVEEGPGGPIIVSVRPEGLQQRWESGPGTLYFRLGERRSPGAMLLLHT